MRKIERRETRVAIEVFGRKVGGQGEFIRGRELEFGIGIELGDMIEGGRIDECRRGGRGRGFTTGRQFKNRRRILQNLNEGAVVGAQLSKLDRQLLVAVQDRGIGAVF
jgi:hypothetical protein